MPLTRASSCGLGCDAPVSMALVGAGLASAQNPDGSKPENPVNRLLIVLLNTFCLAIELIWKTSQKS